MTSTWTEPEPTRRCTTCGATAPGSPPDWLRVTVNDDSHQRGYRVFGTFCTTECLAAKLPEVTALLTQIDHLKAEIDRRQPEPDTPLTTADIAGELLVLSDIVGRLEALAPDAQQRCTRYVADRYRTPAAPETA